MGTILQLNTGLFPDAVAVAEAIATRTGVDRIVRLDAGKLDCDDTDSWDGVVTAILQADLVVTL